MKPFTLVAVGLFAFVSLAHLCRLWQGWEITIAGSAVPMWVSLPGAILPGALAYLLWHESRHGQH